MGFFDSFVEFFKEVFGFEDDCCHSDCRRGEVCLTYGKHTLEINVEQYREIHSIYITVDDNCQTVCLSDITTVGTSILTDSFMLYADVKSDHCKIKWIAFLGS
jgi:hypothetical protein